MPDGGCRMAGAGWRMADGGWRMADGGWRVASGEWRVLTMNVPFGVLYSPRASTASRSSSLSPSHSGTASAASPSMYCSLRVCYGWAVAGWWDLVGGGPRGVHKFGGGLRGVHNLN